MTAVLSPVPFLEFGTQHGLIRGELLAAVTEVLDSQQFILGRKGIELEQAIARDIGVKHAIGLASGTDALSLALAALDIGAGHEVITTPFTFFATAGCISRAQAKPVFVDIDPQTFQIDPARISQAITPRTRAVLPVHLFGLGADMEAINAIAESRKLPVIEDAAQSYGSQIHGQKTGGLSLAGCLSFYPTKNLGGGGDGGMVVTSDDRMADKVRLLRVHGSRQRYYHEVIGVNSRLDEIQAAILLVKLKYIARWNEARARLARRYSEGLKGLPIQTPVTPKGFTHTYHLYTVRCGRRDELSRFLSERGVGTGVYYPVPLHLQACYRDLGYKAGDFPQTEKASAEVLSLPMYPELSESAVDSVVAVIREFFGRS